jgi:hypothetical protein
MIASLKICKQQIESSDLRSELKDIVEVNRSKSLQDFIDRNEPGKAYLVGWRGHKSTWATILVIGNDGSFLVSRNPLPENTLKGRVILKGENLSKTFDEVKDELLCLETDY